MDHPGIAVVIPVFNGEQHVAAALESVLAQQYEVAEVIVVDDGSTDATHAVCSRFIERFRSGQLRILTGRNAGVSTARNRGILAARAEFIAFLDADDTWDPEHLATLLPALSHDPLPVMIFSDARHGESGQVLDRIRVRLLAASEPWGVSTTRLHRVVGSLREILFDTFAGLSSSMLVPRDAFASVGLFDRTIQYAEDLDLIARLVVTGPVLWHDGATVRLTVRPGSLSATRPGPEQELSLAQVLTRIRHYDQQLTAVERPVLDRAITLTSKEAAYGASDLGVLQYLATARTLREWSGRWPPSYLRLLLRAWLRGSQSPESS